MAAAADLDLDSAIPTGPWTLYFHSPDETRWTLNTFTSLGSMHTWRDFWSIIDTMKTDAFNNNMFVMMHDPIPPLWESHQNVYGGCYSLRFHHKDAPEGFIQYMIAAMLGGINTKTPNNTINGLSISPKRGINIVKIWNVDSKTYHQASDLVYGISPHIKESDVIYAAFLDKKL
jgi:hypothetical protein